MTTPPAIPGAHVCRESENPRNAGYCACGHKLPRLLRDRPQECEITAEVASSFGVDVTALNLMAEQRADSVGAKEYGDGFPELRNFEREAQEEIADARNYGVWRLQAILWGLVDDGGRSAHVQRGLNYLALAFEEFRSAENCVVSGE